MTNHEAFILGWVYGRVEKLLPNNYDNGRNKFENASHYPLAGMGIILAEANLRKVITKAIDVEIAGALDKINPAITDEESGILPVPLQGSWQLGYYQAVSGNSLDHFDIKTARENANMTQEQLSEKLGVPQSSIARWETGSVKPRNSMLNKIKDILK